MLDALVASRLVIADQDTVEVAHEAVCRAWPRLQAWLDEDRDGLRLHRHLAQASREWDQAGRDPSELYRGARLVAALDWAQRDDADVNESERAFLDASADQRDAEERQARRRIRRLRAGLIGVGLLLVVAMLAGVFAVRSGREAAGQRDTARAAQQEAQVQRDGAQAAQQVAQEERDNARAAQREAQDQRESAELDALVSRSLALRSSNRTLAALLAVEAHRRRPDAAAWSALLATFTATPNFQGYQYLPAERFVTGTLVPGTSNAVVALDGFDLVLVDLVTGEIDKRFAPAPDGLLTYSGLRVSGDGRFVAQLIELPADAAASTLVVYDVATGQVVFGPFTPPFFAADVALNTDGSLVALAGGPNGDLAVYRLADGQPVGTLLGIARPQGINLNRETAALEFGVDGHLYWGSILGPIRVVDVSAMQVVHTYEAPLLSSNNQIIVTSSGLLVAAGDEAAVAVDITTSSIRWTMARQPGSNACSSIAVAEGSGHFYCRNTLSTGAGQNIGRVGRLEERDLTTGLPTGISFDPQQGTAGDVGVTDDERELVTFSHNAPLISRWRLDGSGAVVTRVGQQRGRISGGFDPTGTMMLLADQPRPSLWIQETERARRIAPTTGTSGTRTSTR